METLQTIAEKIRRYRQEQGLTLDEFAGMTGMNKGNLSKIENGKLGIGMPVLIRLLNALDCRMEIFPSSLKSTVRFYRNTSTVYRLTEDNGMDYLCTLPALEERLNSMVGEGRTFLTDMPCKNAVPVRIDGKSYYTYTVDGLIEEARKIGSLPPPPHPVRNGTVTGKHRDKNPYTDVHDPARITTKNKKKNESKQ